MNWSKLIYVLIIVLLYVPMVFLGANVFFPEYTGSNAHFRGYDDCYGKRPYLPQQETLSEEQRIDLEEQQRVCSQEMRQKEQEFNAAKLAYEGRKYTFLALFNFAILLLALFLPRLQDSVTMGLFLGAIAATFGATIRYFDTQSKIGFIILVITFLAMLYFINRKKESFVDWKSKKRK